MSREPLEEYKFKEKFSLIDLEAEIDTVHKVNCPSCSANVPADNLNIQTNIAICHNCQGIFSFHQKVDQLSNQNRVSQEILQPEGVELSRFLNELDISIAQPWSGIEIFLISIIPFLVFISGVLFAVSIPPSDFARIALLSYYIISFIGYISYFFIRKQHKLHVHIDHRNLYIERRPRKLIKDKHIAIQDIDQVYTKNVISTANGSRGVGVFIIVNGDTGQKHVELIKSVSSRSKAKYIEQQIEKYLEIPDRRVPDEDA